MKPLKRSWINLHNYDEAVWLVLSGLANTDNFQRLDPWNSSCFDFNAIKVGWHDYEKKEVFFCNVFLSLFLMSKWKDLFLSSNDSCFKK